MQIRASTHNHRLAVRADYTEVVEQDPATAQPAQRSAA